MCEIILPDPVYLKTHNSNYVTDQYQLDNTIYDVEVYFEGRSFNFTSL